MHVSNKVVVVLRNVCLGNVFEVKYCL